MFPLLPSNAKTILPSTSQLMVQQVSSMVKESLFILNHLDVIFTFKMPSMAHFTAFVLHADLKSNTV